MAKDWLDEIESQLDSTVPYYLPRLIAELRNLRERVNRKPAFLTDYQRMWDLVRHQRAELLDAGLITQDEYAQLLMTETEKTPNRGSPSPRGAGPWEP